MPRSLWRLLWMKLYASVRRAVRVQGNPKKLVLLVIGVVALCLWVGPMVVLGVRSSKTPTDLLEVYGPLGLAAFAVFSLLTSSGETAIAFQPAEVDLLFPGPYTRRQLLMYKMASGMMGSLAGAVVFSVMFLPYAGTWPNSLVGFVLALWFLQFLGTGVALVRQLVGELAYTRARRVGVIAAVGGVAALVAAGAREQSLEDVRAVVESINASGVGRVVLAPFRVFTTVVMGNGLGAVAGWIGAGVGINAALALVVVRLDADYLEASIRASERHAERLRRARSGNVFAPAPGRAVKSRGAGKGRWLWGAGPIVWRQSTTLSRGGKKWVFQLVMMLVVAGVMLSMMHRVPSGGSAPWIGVGVLAYVTVIMSAVVRFDFRADLDHIETLKSLPLTAWAIAMGELVMPVLMLAAVQALLVAGMAALLEWPRAFVVGAAVGAPVVNFLILGVENLLFLAFPARLSNRGIADFSLMGRQMLLFMGKGMIYMLVGTATAGVAWGVHAATGSLVGAMAGAWVVLACAAVGAVLGVARMFRAFDVSADMPG